MIQDKVRYLIAKLLSKTLKKTAIWNQTSRTTEFYLSFPAGKVTIDKWFDENVQSEIVDLAIYNINGEKADYVRVAEGTTDFSELDELYKAATRAYYKVDETLNEMIKSLDSNEIVGGEVSSQDEDLEPF